MNSQGPPQGALPFSEDQIRQMIAMEAQKRGMSIEEFQAFQRRQVEEAAAAEGISVQEFVKKKQQEMRENAMRAQQQAAAQQRAPGGQSPQPGQGPPPGGQPDQPQQQVHQIPIHNPPPPKPEALSVAKFLRGQNLKLRTCIFEGQRKDMFKVKRALRALESDAYKKARAKDPFLPPVENDEQARNALQLLPLSVLALRVVKKDPNEGHEGHDHAKKKEKKTKGLWTVQIHGQQEFDPMMHYMWLYEGSQWKTKIWSVLALVAVFAVVLFPLWPLFMRQGVWYLSVGAMGLLGVFFAMAIFRLILFCVTLLVTPPGLWLFPNLFEDVGFFDSFKPLWGWQETKESKKAAKDAKKAKKADKAAAVAPGVNGSATVVSEKNGAAVSTAAEPVAGAVVPTRRHAATVEEVDDE